MIDLSRSAAIVGTGCVSHAGIGMNAFRFALKSGRNAENPALAPTGPELEASLSGLGYPRPPRPSMMCLSAAREAWDEAGVAETVDPNRLGVLINRNFAQHQLAEKYLRRVWESGAGSASGLQFIQTIANTVLGFVATQFKARGPSELFFGPSSMGMALDLLRANRADVILAGGLDEYSDYSQATSECWGWKDLLPGEGAVFLALERPTPSLHQSKRVLGYLKGYDMRFDPLGRCDPAQRDHRCLVRLVRRALEDARTPPEEVGLVSISGGGGLSAIDRIERTAIEEVFGANVKLIATKPIFGETWGAAGGVGVLGALHLLGEESSATALILVTDVSGQNCAFVISKEDQY